MTAVVKSCIVSLLRSVAILLRRRRLRHLRGSPRFSVRRELLESMSVLPLVFCQWRQVMATTSRGRAQDRSKIAGGQDHEVKYEAKKEGVSKDTVKNAVK